MSKYFRKIIYLILIKILIVNFLLGNTSSFQFAWMTDTHIGAANGKKYLKKAVNDINKIDELEFVIVSGDLTAYDIKGKLDTAKKVLDKLKTPYFVIPGNHDTKWSATGGTKFEKLWGKEEFSFVHKGVKFIGFGQGPIMRMGFGYVVPEDLRWLKEELKSMEDPKMPVVIVTHFPLDSSVGNYQKVLKILKQYNVQVILHGHGHTNRDTDYEDIPGVMGLTPLESDGESGYNLVKYSNDKLEFEKILLNEEETEQWYNISLKNREYKIDSTARSKSNPLNKKYSDVELEWQYNTGASITNPPAIADKKVYVGNSKGKLYSISLKTGNLLWTFQAENKIYSTPAVKGEKVVFGSTDSTVYCLDTETGNVEWKYKGQAPIVASPAIKKDKVFIGGSEGVFRAIDLNEGELIWKYKNVEGFVESQPLLYNGKVIFGAWDNTIYALDQTGGELVWKWEQNSNGVLLSPAVCKPIGVDNRIYFVAPDRTFYCLGSNTGKLKWKSERDKVRESLGVSENGNMLFAKCMEDTVFTIDPRETEFKYVWKRSMEYGYDIAPSPPVEKSDVVFISTAKGNIIASQAKTGKVLWKYSVSNGLVNKPIPISGKSVITSAMDGKVSYIKNKE